MKTDKRTRFYRHYHKGLHTKKCYRYIPALFAAFCGVTDNRPWDFQTLDTHIWMFNRLSRA